MPKSCIFDFVFGFYAKKSNPEPDDGKRLQTCLKRLELLFRAKLKRRGFGGNAREGWAPERMTESAFKLVWSVWSCCQERSLREGGLGETAFTAGRGSGFLGISVVFSIKNRSKKWSKFNIFFWSFLVSFGAHLGAIWEAKIDLRWPKLGLRRLLKRYFLKNVDFHETV